MHCPYCGQQLDNDYVLPAEVECGHCNRYFWIDCDIAYGDMLEDGFMLINPYNTEAYA